MACTAKSRSAALAWDVNCCVRDSKRGESEKDTRNLTLTGAPSEGCVCVCVSTCYTTKGIDVHTYRGPAELRLIPHPAKNDYLPVPSPPFESPSHSVRSLQSPFYFLSFVKFCVQTPEVAVVVCLGQFGLLSFYSFDLIFGASMRLNVLCTLSYHIISLLSTLQSNE